MRQGHQTPSESSADDHLRQRKFHRRSRNGCQQCKAKRIRCDEQRPACGNCTRRGTQELCIFHNAAQAPIADTSTALISSTYTPVNNDTENGVVSLSGQDFDWSLLQDQPTSAFVGGTPLDFMSLQMPDWLVNFELPSTQAIVEPLNNQLCGQTSLITNGMENVSATAYARQMEILQQPDVLATYFPSEEQRRLFHHFVHETALDLLVIPAVADNNPWLACLSPLALCKPSGQDPTHDALRAALLSLASFDIGMKMNGALKHSQDNAMYGLSEAQRTIAMKLLDLGVYVDAVENDMDSADLTVATAVILAIRDRLAGSQEWEGPVNHGIKAIAVHHGPAQFLKKNASPERRFLLEQMACADLLGAMTVCTSPKVLQWDNEDWLKWHGQDKAQDNLTLVYGWDRATLQVCARVMILGDEARQLDTLTRENATFAYPAVKDSIKRREVALSLRSAQLLEEIKHVRKETLPLVLPTRAVRGVTSLLLTMEIALMADPLGLECALNDEKVQAKVRTVLNDLDEAISQGMYSGFLLPLIWMAICAASDNKQRVERLFDKLQPHYRIDPNLMKRLARFNWSTYATEGYDRWEEIMKVTQTYVPVF